MKQALRDLVPAKLQVAVKYWFNRFGSGLEPEMELLSQLVRRNDRVIDVGGNRGTYAYKLSKLGARIEVFEPNPRCFQVLSAWAHGKCQIDVHQVALSDRSGPAVLHVPVDEAGIEHDAAGSIEQGAHLSGRTETVELRTLDSYAFADICFIKIDVEGHEAAVIRGAANTIRSHMPTMLVEIEQRHSPTPISEIFDLILTFGYRGFFLRNGLLEPLSAFDLGRDQDALHVGKANEYINNFLFLTALRTQEVANLLRNSPGHGIFSILEAVTPGTCFICRAIGPGKCRCLKDHLS